MRYRFGFVSNSSSSTSMVEMQNIGNYKVTIADLLVDMKHICVVDSFDEWCKDRHKERPEESLSQEDKIALWAEETKHSERFFGIDITTTVEPMETIVIGYFSDAGGRKFWSNITRSFLSKKYKTTKKSKYRWIEGPCDGG